MKKFSNFDFASPLRFAGTSRFSIGVVAALGMARVLAGEPGSRASEPLADIGVVDPGIVVDLRYATSRNVLGCPIYPAGARAVVRQSVAERLKVAQAYLRERGYGLKIWDAFRPTKAQVMLWEFAKNARYVADPEYGHAMHTWGVAVDATLVDAHAHDVPMPSDLDAFSEQAALHYQGGDALARWDLDLLLHAMGAAGFKGMRSEWWHFVAPDWQDFGPVTAEQAKAFRGK
jgi:D-alanyl-D-alanine dipeptidase